MSNFEKAIEASKELSLSEGSGHRVMNHLPEFLDGELFEIAFEGPNGEELGNFVYIERDQVTVCKNPPLLNELVARKTKKNSVLLFLGSIGGVAGVIGLIITLTICYIVVVHPESEVPKELWAALTAILAFYFGSKVSK